MSKYNKKILKTKIILVQFLYAYYLHGNIDSGQLDFVLIKNNVNKFFYVKLQFFFLNIIAKDLFISSMLDRQVAFINTNSLISKIILKIAIFELYFCDTSSINDVNANTLVLLKKFCTRYDYITVKSGLVYILNGYKFFKLLG